MLADELMEAETVVRVGSEQRRLGDLRRAQHDAVQEARRRVAVDNRQEPQRPVVVAPGCSADSERCPRPIYERRNLRADEPMLR
jgi:hypothetical protein